MSENRLFFLVTGASGGFGAAILRQINTMYGDQACIVACSRNMEKVAENTKDFTASVRTIAIEFTKSEGMKESCEKALELFPESKFSECYLFNNHGSLNDTSRKINEYDNTAELTDYYLLNVISFQVLTAVFLNKFEGLKHTVVNISSICAVKPFSTFGLYCPGKACRKMLYEVLAKEHPEVKVLSYSPGPMETAMTQNVHNESVDEGIRTMFSELKSTGRWVDVDESASKMMQVLRDAKYENGAHIDFFDR